MWRLPGASPQGELADTSTRLQWCRPQHALLLSLQEPWLPCVSRASPGYRGVPQRPPAFGPSWRTSPHRAASSLRRSRRVLEPVLTCSLQGRAGGKPPKPCAPLPPDLLGAQLGYCSVLSIEQAGDTRWAQRGSRAAVEGGSGLVDPRRGHAYEAHPVSTTAGWDGLALLWSWSSKVSGRGDWAVVVSLCASAPRVGLQ